MLLKTFSKKQQKLTADLNLSHGMEHLIFNFRY